MLGRIVVLFVKLLYMNLNFKKYEIFFTLDKLNLEFICNEIHKLNLGPGFYIVVLYIGYDKRLGAIKPFYFDSVDNIYNSILSLFKNIISFLSFYEKVDKGKEFRLVISQDFSF